MNIRLTYTKPQAEIFFTNVRRFNAIAKGRRFGATRGAAHACIEWALEGMPILWGDTIAGNVERYWQRYFQPALHTNGIDGHLSSKNVGTIGGGYIDFRSADRPENWEGFGYRKIILNEAGIILSDPYLYTNAVLPMMMDYPDAELFAMGVPKGKKLRDGSEHPFSRIFHSDTPQHRSMTFSTWDNPFLSPDDIAMTVAEISAMDPMQEQQEIYGKFIDGAAGMPFAFAFDPDRHVKPCALRPGEVVRISLDFNVEPFCATLWHIGPTHAHCFAEISIKEGTIEAMQRAIRDIVGPTALLELTGDHNGTNRSMGLNSTASLFDSLRAQLRLSPRQLVVRPNPSHLKSREDVNFVLANFGDFRIDPSCRGTIADLQSVEVDDKGAILKKDRSKATQRADLLDTVRYAIGTYLWQWIESHRNELSKRGALRPAKRVPDNGRIPVHREPERWL